MPPMVSTLHSMLLRGWSSNSPASAPFMIHFQLSATIWNPTHQHCKVRTICLQDLISWGWVLGPNLYTHIRYRGETGKPWGRTPFLAIFFGALRPGWRQPHNYITGIFLHHRRHHAQQKPLLVVPECGIYFLTTHHTYLSPVSLSIYNFALKLADVQQSSNKTAECVQYIAS